MSRKIAILGLGSRGRAWAEAFCEAGWRVSGFDPDQAATGLSSARRGWRRDGTISTCVAGADWVLLCLPERMELVQKVVQRAQAEAPDGAVLGVVSDAFDVDAIQGCAIRPGRIVLIDGLPQTGAELKVSHRNQSELKVDALAVLSEICAEPALNVGGMDDADQVADAKSA